MKTKKTLKIILTIFFLIGLIDGLFIEPSRLLFHEQTLKLSNWPEALDGLRVAVIADIHPGSPFITLDKVNKIVAHINTWNPDVVLMVGDFVEHVLGGRFVFPEQTAKALSNIHAPKVAVLGNHDWYFDGERVRNALKKEGIVVLENESHELLVHDTSLWIVGMADAWTRLPDVEEAFKRVPENEPVVVLTHNPVLLPEIPTSAALTIAGHTHGGQINLPWITYGFLILIRSGHYPPGYTVENGRHLYISTGIGTSILPVRFRATPQVDLLTLK